MQSPTLLDAITQRLKGQQDPTDPNADPLQTTLPVDTKGPEIDSSGAALPTIGTPAPTNQYANMLSGFNPDKLNDPNKHDPKYDFARVAENYAPTPAGLAQLAQDPAFQATGDKYLGGDKVQVPNGSVIDVGLSFGSGGNKGWAWQPTSGPDAQQNGSPAPLAGGGIAPALQGDAIGNINTALQSLGQSQNTGYLAQLLAALRSGGQ